ncbi:unnamed protein product [Scytosiphon promiscuus]
MTSNDEFEYAPEAKANAISFEKFCRDVLEKMATMKGSAIKLDLVMPFLSTLGKESAFPIMRLLLPELDNLRDKYGMRTKMMASLFAGLYFPHKKGEQYYRLQSYTDPEKNPSPGDKRWQVTGDFALTLEYVLTPKPDGLASGSVTVEETTWTIGDVNDALTDLSNADGNKGRETVLRRIRANCSPMNQNSAWLATMILKNLKISMKKSVLNRFHPDALDEYNRTTSLRRVCSAFIGRHSSIRSTSNIEVMTSFSPMLATNYFYKTEKIIPGLQGHPFCMDVKLDGERMLCHRDGDKVKWFTRNAKDYTDKYGSSLTPHILAGVSAQKCIIDGEVVTWNDELGNMVPFGSNRTYAKEELEGRGSGTRWLFFVVFDILYVEGPGEGGHGGGSAMNEVVRDAVRNSIAPCPPASEVHAGNLTALPLDVRRRILRSVVTEKKHRLELVKSWEVAAGDEGERKKQLDACFEERVIHLNEEGLVVKDLEGHYVLGDKSRKCALWVKKKPEYSDQTEDMDLLVLAAGFANGKMRSGLLSKFLLGVAVPTEEGKRRREFYALVRVGTGYTMNELEDLNELLKDKWRTFDTNPPHFIMDHAIMNKGGRDGVRMTKWIAPEDSICLQIKSMEVVKAVEWPGVRCTLSAWLLSVMLRVSVCRGESGGQGTSPKATRLCPGTSISMRTGDRTQYSYSPYTNQMLRITLTHHPLKLHHTPNSAPRGIQLFAVGGGGAVAVKEKVFVTANGEKPLELCVMGEDFSRVHVSSDDADIDVDAWWTSSGSKKRKAAGGHERRTKQDIELLIREHGGTVTANPMPTTSFLVVGDKRSVSVKNQIASKGNAYNVVGYRWVLECIERNAYEFPAMRHIHSMSPEARQYFSTIKDDYGDDYTALTDAAALSQLLLNIPEVKEKGQAKGKQPAAESWLSPLLGLDEQDGATLKDGPDFLFAGRCLVYCDLFTDLGSAEPRTAADGVSYNENGDTPMREKIPYNVLGSTAQAIQLYGGEVPQSLHAGVTHVIVDPDDTTRLGAIKERISELHKRDDRKFHIRVVKPAWAWECIERGRLVDPSAEHLVSLSPR